MMKSFAGAAAEEPLLVSIIIPVHNAEKFLVNCLSSVAGQTYGNFEVVLINDGSSDGSEAVCREFATTDSRFTVITTSNCGPAAARNTGLDKSTGFFVCFVDADDFLQPEAIGTMVCRYLESGSDLIVTDFTRIINGERSVSGHRTYFPESRQLSGAKLLDYTLSYLRKPNRHYLFVYSWGRLFRASVIRDHNIRFDPSLKTFEDVSFNFTYLKFIKSLYYENTPLYNHLVHDNYTSSSMKIMADPDVLFGYRQALCNVSNYLHNVGADVDVERVTGHAYICYTIIQLVRTCGQINDSCKENIRNYIDGLLDDSLLQRSLRYYEPTKGDSRILPLLMKFKLTSLIMFVCACKARKRYAKR